MEDNRRPDLEGNDEAISGAATAAARAADTKADDGGAGEGSAPYFAAGKAFTNWFNGMLTRTPNPVLKLGTKTARVEALLDDGRLEVRLEGEGGEGAKQFIAFEAQYLDALLLKFASAARSAAGA